MLPERGQIPLGPCPFEIESGGKADVIFPAPGLQWECNVADDVPSTFGFVMYVEAEQQALAISRLKISLRN